MGNGIGNYNMSFYGNNMMSSMPAWQGVPYSLPQYNGGMFNPMFTFGGSTSTSSTSSNGKYMTTEEYNKKQSEKYAKGMAAYQERRVQKQDTTQALDEVKDGIKAMETGKKEDGSVVIEETMEEHKKQPWWKKALRATGNMVKGAWDLCMKFVGYDENGKWNWKKCLKNLAVAGVCIGVSCIPVVGPVVTTGLLTLGVASGAYGVGKGIYKATKAETVEEIDHAFQDIGQGVFIGASSAAGLRGLGKSLQAASAAEAAGGAASSATRSMGSNAISQFCKDMTVNAWKATIRDAAAQKVAMQAAAQASNGSKIAGFFKTWGSNLGNLVPKLGNGKFKDAQASTQGSIDARLQEIEQTLNSGSSSLTADARAVLEQEQSILAAQKTQIANTQTQGAWKTMAYDSQAHKGAQGLNKLAGELETNGSATLGGHTFSNNEATLKAIQESASRVQKLSNEVQKLSATRESTMKWMALKGKNKAAVEAFTGKQSSTGLGRLWDVFAGRFTGKSFLGGTWECVKSAPKLAWEAMAIPFKPWTFVDKTAAGSFYKIEQTFVPEYGKSMIAGMVGGGQTLTAEQAEQTLAQLQQQEQALSKQLEKLEKVA